MSIYLDEYDETPWEALKFLIAAISYGGHVTDDWDRRLLNTYIGDYFCEEALTVPFFRFSSSSSVSYYLRSLQLNVWQWFVVCWDTCVCMCSDWPLVGCFLG